MLIEQADFNGSYMQVDSNFKIVDENAIYLGPNGIGKTTTYRIAKAKFPSYGFFSYDDCKEKITKEKKKIRIDIRTVDIEKLKQTKTDILNEIDLKNNGFKSNNITSATKAGEYSNYCKDSYNDNELAINNFNDEKIALLDSYPESPKKTFLFQNIDSISKLCLSGNELNEIKNKYILEAMDLLEKALDDSDTVCPVCGHEHHQSIIEIYIDKKKEYSNNLNSIIDKYRAFSKLSKYEIEKDIKEMMDLVNHNNLKDIDITNYILVGKDQKNSKKILEAKEKIKDINKEIIDLEQQRKEFFDNLITNWDKIERVLKNIFKENGITITTNDDEKSITVNLKREASTYSTGELNYIVFIINILEFEYSNRSNIIIDDPLSSYDIKKQYEIAFDIISRLVKNNKNVIIFTHNINLINIINSQYPSKFKYYFIDMIKTKLKVFDIKMKKDGSVLNIGEILNYLETSDPVRKWIELLIEKDINWEETSPKHKLFHYDGSYTDCETGLSNDDLIKLIDDFSELNIEDFEKIASKKILYLAAMRVWIEKKLADNYNGILNGNLLFPKINNYFKHPECWKSDLGIDKEELTKKKVLLNQNEHYKSQIIPFHYALSISTDELVNDILELKALFVS